MCCLILNFQRLKQVFNRRRFSILKIYGGWVFCTLFTVLLTSQQLPELKHKPVAPKHPLPFSHKTHVSQGLTCVECHTMPAPGDYAEIVGSTKCMHCHLTIKTESPSIQKLTWFHNNGRQIPWEPIYLIPDYVFFSHAVHVKEVGAQCVDCHGPVGKRDILAKERDISMTACMDCHRVKGGSLQCDYCHDTR